MTTPISQSDGDVDQTEQTQPGKLNRLPAGLHVGKISDIGQEREQNEDSFLVFDALIQHNYGQEPFGLFIVADGMGGHQQGEVASALATRTVASQILQEVYLPYLTQDKQPAANRPINEVLVTAVQKANTAVQDTAPDGGTTLTVALVMGNNAYLAHVGDSRAYLFKQDECKQITKDHSLAQRLEDLGQSAPAETAHVKNVLYKAIGQNTTIEVDTYIQHLPPGSSLLLCSDGLWGLVANDVLTEIINSSATPQAACERLVKLANENGGHDNITAVVVTMGAES
ncbi:MAG: protein phosphatase 2C domain-containing protein [Chloroflexota bacterium]